MAEITLTVTDVTTFNRSAGELVVVGDWTDGFDHAALVAARRSRSDAKDMWIRHTTAGFVPIVSIAGANTSACKVSFNLAAGILGSMGDANYRLVFGDLGRNFQTTTAAGTGSGGSVAVADGSVPALTLPATYGFPLTEVNDYGVREFGQRRGTWHENTQQTLSLRYAAASGETAYEIRALIESTRGAGTFTVSGFDYVYVPGSLSWVQTSAVNYDVSLEIRLATL